LTSPPILQAPKSGVPFRLYIAAEESVIGAILTQEADVNILLLMKVKDYWMSKKCTLSLKSYIYLYIMLVPSWGIICYQVLVLLHAKPTNLNAWCKNLF
jgi:hypothetical protein